MIHIDIKKQLHSAQGQMLLDVNLSIEQGKFVSIYGKSGAGKTTLFKILAGLIEPSEGKILVENSIWFDKNININATPQNRNIGFVFQDYALFPNMTIRENLEFVLNSNSDKSRINEILEIMELGELFNRKPATLSGGQQQRVALARALIRNPQILLLDEPLSALDHETRLKLQNEILKIHQHFNLTTIMISHDIAEIYQLSDNIVEMSDGKIISNKPKYNLFKTQHIKNQIQLTGEIVKMSETTITILTGFNLFTIEKDQFSNYNIGSKVVLSTNLNNLNVIIIE